MTTHKSCWRRPRALAIEAALWFLLLCIAAVTCAPAARAGGGVPDWVRNAAAEKLPTYNAEIKAVQLLDDTEIVVKDDGQVVEHYRGAFRILRPEGIREFEVAGVPYGSWSRILLFKAWNITPSGEEIEVSDKDIEEAGLSSYEVYTDFREKLVRFPVARVGSVVAFEYIQQRTPFHFDEDWYFQSGVPSHDSRISLQLPPGWEYTALWANMSEQKPEMPSPNTYVWEVKDSPAIEIEPHMPPASEIAAHVYLKYFPSNPALRSKITGTWQEVGSWAWSLEEPMLASTSEIKEKVAELTAGKTTTLEKMEALTEYVQRQIRYAAIEIGIGGWQPHSAGDVLTHQYGDCKDKATLLSAMLADIGVKSYDVAINTRRGVTNPQFPSNEFDHMITAIVIPDDVPENMLYTEMKDPKFRRIALFDPTNEFVPLGYLPSYEQDSYGLIFGPNGSELVHTPILPAATNRVLRTAKLALDSTGNLSGEIQETMWGNPAAKKRETLVDADQSQRAKIMESFLGNFLDNFTLTRATIGNLDIYDQFLTLNYQISADNYAKSAGDLLIVRPRVVGESSGVFLGKKERKYPVEFSYARIQSEVFDITLPAGYKVDELPEPMKAECEFGKFQSEVGVEGSTLEYKRSYEINSIMVPTAKLQELREFLGKIEADDNASVVLKKITP